MSAVSAGVADTNDDGLALSYVATFSANPHRLWVMHDPTQSAAGIYSNH